MKTIRCVVCRGEFTDEEIVGALECPGCGAKGLPMYIRHDVEVVLNWHELRILAIWAGNYARQAGPEAQAALEAICTARIRPLRPKDAPPLTLEEEVRELQETHPKTTLVSGEGEIIVPAKPDPTDKVQ